MEMEMGMKMGNNEGGQEAGMSGDPYGHYIPATFFTGFGVFYMILIYNRCVRIARSNKFLVDRKKGGDQMFWYNIYTHMHCPERNASVSYAVGITATIATSIGFWCESLNAWYFGFGFFFQMGHMLLYTLYFFVGVVLLLESYYLVPADSHRLAVSFALLCEYVTWNEHGMMKKNHIDQRVHILLGQICLVSGLMFIASVCNKRNFILHVLGPCTLTYQGLWIYTAGYNVNHPLNHDQVSVFITLEALLILVAVTCMAVRCSAIQGSSKDNFYMDYEQNIYGTNKEKYALISHRDDAQLDDDEVLNDHVEP